MFTAPLLAAFFIACTFCTCAAVKLEKEYFTDVSMTCDDPRFNLTEPSSTTPPPETKYWMLPNGDLLSATSTDGRVKISPESFNITITKIDDPDFGWYYCLLIWSNHSLDVIQYGVNVDGPYYGDLLSKYRHNAMVGGIAAAILFVLLAGSCLIWHFFTHKRRRQNKAVDDLDKAIYGSDTTAYDNVALEMDKTPASKEISTVILEEKL